MSETNAVPAQADTTVAPAPAGLPAKLAGKYETPEQLGNAIREAHKMLGLEELPADKPVWGEGAKLGDINQAEWHYNQLNKLISKGAHKVAAAEPKPADAPVEPKPTVQNQVVPKSRDEALKATGLNQSDLQAQIEANGDLSADVYAKLTAAGVPEADIKKEVADAKANMAAWKEADAIVGSREQHNTLRSWVTQNVKGADLEAIAKLAADPKTYPHAVRMMQSKYDESIGANGSGSSVTGGPAAPVAAGIQSKSEFSAVMSRVLRGDMEAIKLLEQTPHSKINEWSKN